MSQNNEEKSGVRRRFPTAKAAIAASVIVVIAAWWMWADKAATAAGHFVALNGYLSFFIAGIVVFGVLAAVNAFLHVDAHRPTYRLYFRPAPGSPDVSTKKFLAAAGVCALVAVVFAGVVVKDTFFGRYGYDVDRQIAAESLSELDDEMQPGYDYRVAYPVAVATIERRLGLVANDSDGALRPSNAHNVTHMLDEQGDPVWCSVLVPSKKEDRRHLVGVACVDQDLHVEIVNFDGDVPSPKAQFSKNLRRQVSHVARGHVYDDGDVYGYIADGHANLVVPMKKTVGFKHAYDVPAGVVIFDSNGHTVWHRNVESGEIPGPVMPMSIAEDVRSSLGGRGSFSHWRDGRLSFEDTATTSGSSDDESAEKVDALDPNLGNLTEFHMVNSETGRLEFVTPLTPNGRSTNVVAVSVVSSDTVTYGKLPELRLYKLPQIGDGTARLTNGDVLARLVTRYGRAIPFAETAEQLAAGTKFRVMEITPGSDPEVWTSTVGLPNSPEYRIEFNRVTAESCVYEYTSGRQLRCDDGDTVSVPVDALSGGRQSSSDDELSGESSNDIFDVSDLSDAELIDLLDELSAELEGRLGSGSPAASSEE